ncbi:MAG: aldehyde dehydrogenase family protein, partial [Alphaproteobacteria bacterium]|nr:aldehyde dehydrogenase family protein [Alphaproteobacteria bacterium]
MTARKKAAAESNIQILSLADTAGHLLKKLGVNSRDFSAGNLKVFTPVDGSLLGIVKMDSPAQLETKIARAHDAFLNWRTVPAPQRGELIRVFGEVLRENKDDLGKLV